MSAPTNYPKSPAWLAGIPGYSGYHAKEQRRLADRALREDLARRVTAAVQQLQRLSAALARARRFGDLGPVDGLTGRLQHLADRLRAAPEGYRGLFEQERVDEAVLDQVIAFDTALAAGVERLGVLVAGLSERAPGPVLDTPAGMELVELAERLHARLDARTAIFASGARVAPETALAVLQDPPRPAPKLSLKPGDAVSYGSTDLLVDAVVTYQGDRAWTEYRLRDARAERWLVAEPAAASLLAPAAAEEVNLEEDDSATIGGQRYRLRAYGQATASLVGPAGEQRNVPVTFRDYRDDDDGVLAIRDWGGERRVYRGNLIDPALLTVYPRT
jgi:hypothetical protein